MEKTRVTALAATIGMLWVNRPNKSQSRVPKVKSEYINKDIPEVSFVCMVLMAWGKKEMVVHIAAPDPNSMVKFINNINNDVWQIKSKK